MVVHVPQLPFDIEVSAEERGRQFRYQLFSGVSLRAEAAFQVAIEGGLVSRPVSKLVQGGCEQFCSEVHPIRSDIADPNYECADCGPVRIGAVSLLAMTSPAHTV
jgi:hypothetical protein